MHIKDTKDTKRDSEYSSLSLLSVVGKLNGELFTVYARAEAAEADARECRAERARYGDAMTARLAGVEAERDVLYGALREMRAYINKYVTLTDSERWLLTTIEAALPD